MCWCCQSKPKASNPIVTDMSLPSKKQVSVSKQVSKAVHIGNRKSFSQIPSVASLASSQKSAQRIELANAQPQVKVVEDIGQELIKT